MKYEDELKHCPFCGGEAEFNSNEFGEGVCCKTCGATLHNGVYGEYGRKLTSAEWNTRKIEEAQAAEIARLRGNIEAIKKIVDKPPLSIYDAAQIYAECCDALKGEDK